MEGDGRSGGGGGEIDKVRAKNHYEHEPGVVCLEARGLGAKG